MRPDFGKLSTISHPAVLFPQDLKQLLFRVASVAGIGTSVSRPLVGKTGCSPMSCSESCWQGRAGDLDDSLEACCAFDAFHSDCRNLCTQGRGNGIVPVLRS